VKRPAAVSALRARPALCAGPVLLAGLLAGFLPGADPVRLPVESTPGVETIPAGEAIPAGETTPAAETTPGFHRVRAVSTHEIENGVLITNEHARLTKLAVILPLARSNLYQEITRVKTFGAETVDIPGTGDHYLRFTRTGSDLPAAGESVRPYYSFTVTLYSLRVPLEEITTIHPYDRESEIFRFNTGPSGEYVDPSHPVIAAIGDSLWAKSENELDYARRCYEYVAATYAFVNPLTGLHTLDEIFARGGGDCGNLSSIWVSLVRRREIPARHIVTVRPDATYHVWSDFYLHGYGWIPVDVTYKNLHPEGDFFGVYDGNGIVFTTAAWVLLDFGDGRPYRQPMLQSFNWWYWADETGGIEAEHDLRSK